MSTEPRVATFLAGLATDSEGLARFMSSSDEARRLMDAAGLGDDMQRALTSRDLTAVHAALKAESPAALGLNGPAGVMKKKRKGGKKKKRPPAKPARKRPGGKKPGARKTGSSARPRG